MLKEKCKELQKKIDMLGLELAGMKDANDRNSIDKLKEIDRLKATIDDLTRMVESLKNNSSDQIKDMERMLREKTQKFEQDMKELVDRYETQIVSLCK